MARIASFDADNIDVRKALAERYLGQGDAAAAEKWAGECLQINVYDPAIHVLLADAQAARKQYAKAVEEYQTALELKVKKPDDVRVKLARAQLGLDRRDDARAILDSILNADPDHPEAKALRQQLQDLKAKS